MISQEIHYAGVNDHAIDLFESQYRVPNGMAYNSYVITDEKNAVIDSVDAHFTQAWLDNIRGVLEGKAPDYIVVQHMEPDHSGSLLRFLETYPTAQVVASSKAFAMIKNFFHTDLAERQITVGEGDTLSLGRHTLRFITAPMVHWPEVIMTYDSTDKVLFSADAFGTFGALNGNIFADQVDFERDWLDDARRYYTNIVGKYGAQVQSLLKRAAGMEIQMICPLHGPIWRENLEWFLEKYQRWSTYTPEDRGVAIFCGSIYGHTENAAEILAARLAERGVKNISLYDVSHTDVSYLVSEAFRCSHLVLASATYNGEIYTPMENFLRDLACHGLRGRSVALIENGTWAARSGMLMTKLLEEMKEMRVMEGTVTLKSSVKEAQRRGLESLADAIADELLH